jgi:hypothetical protein
VLATFYVTITLLSWTHELEERRSRTKWLNREG